MKIIPVIDLKAGEVVHARRGERDSYRPVVSQLCRGSRPLDVIAGFLEVHPFDTLYVADLDAIQRRGDNQATIAEIDRAFPQVQLWVDSGRGDRAACESWLERNPGTLVLGSEAVSEPTILRELGDGARIVLSLDFRDEAFLGPPGLLNAVEDWPQRVIVMTLARVGSGAGPDLARLDEVARQAQGRQIFAAGGVRGGEDLRDLARRGIDGVLVASALHDRRIGRAEIAAVAPRPIPG
jgi:phosphoribosylformimino-5-aminoimidazole carboxamide ribotide isomerase